MESERCAHFTGAIETMLLSGGFVWSVGGWVGGWVRGQRECDCSRRSPTPVGGLWGGRGSARAWKENAAGGTIRGWVRGWWWGWWWDAGAAPAATPAGPCCAVIEQTRQDSFVGRALFQGMCLVCCGVGWREGGEVKRIRWQRVPVRCAVDAHPCSQPGQETFHDETHGGILPRGVNS